MKHHQFATDQHLKVAVTVTAVAPSQAEIHFTPSADEVARRAYFSYVNQGAPDGQHVQHWLDAEAELIAERNRTRVHGFHNRT